MQKWLNYIIRTLSYYHPNINIAVKGIRLSSDIGEVNKTKNPVSKLETGFFVF